MAFNTLLNEVTIDFDKYKIIRENSKSSIYIDYKQYWSFTYLNTLCGLILQVKISFINGTREPLNTKKSR